MKGTTVTYKGIGFTGLLTCLFIGLKLCGVINWSWLWVLAPIWIEVLIVIILILILVIIYGFFKLCEDKIAKQIRKKLYANK